MTTKLNIKKSRYVVFWDQGEERFVKSRSAQIYVDKIIKFVAPGKQYGILEVVPPNGGF